jgi:hypothetical protein
MSSREEQTSKKNYRSPQLLVFGDIRVLTQTVDNKGKVADGGTGMTDKS